jgi:hypothetical protein|nr:MAG TPA: Protein of unknown function (DUF1642) [Caudoviricetes sp.]
MNKRELIKHIEDLPYKEGSIVDKIYISRKGLLELVNQLDEPGKPVVPPVVSVWYQINKNNLYKNIAYLCANWAKSTTYDALFDWMSNTDNFIEILVKMHQFGYEVEKEKRYWVKLKAVDQYLVSAKDEKFLGFLQSKLRSKFTRKELEDLGFGWVFDCEGIEIEEVE